MNIIDAYGDFDLPEEKSVIEVVEDPVKIVSSCYDVFKRFTRKSKIKNNNIWYEYETYIDPVYKEALKVFGEKQELKADNKQLKEILREIRKKAENYDGTGLFLSALINSTKINILFIDGFPKLDQIGYNLKENKTILLGLENIFCHELGLYAKGNTINQGSALWQSTFATGGTHVNQQIIRHQGYGATTGNHINQGTITTSQGFTATGGNHINKEETAYQRGTPYEKGKYINLKRIAMRTTIIPISLIDLYPKKSELKTELEQKLDELDFLKTEEPEKLIQLASKYDWNKFGKEINEICNKIQEAYGRK